MYGLTNNNWSQGALTWAGAPNLKQNVAAGKYITNTVISGLGDSAFIQGQLVFSSTNFVEQQIDVTDFIRTHTNSDATFLVSQDPRWNLTLPSLTPGDTQPDGIRIVSLEGAGNNTAPPPALQLVFVPPTNGPAAPSGLIAAAVSASQIEALPHQITAVYGEMLPRQPLRFLLADDPGAGKTIMGGLTTKELKFRGLVERYQAVSAERVQNGGDRLQRSGFFHRSALLRKA